MVDDQTIFKTDADKVITKFLDTKKMLHDPLSLSEHTCVPLNSGSRAKEIVLSCPDSKTVGENGSQPVWRGIPCQQEELASVVVHQYLRAHQQLFGLGQCLLFLWSPLPLDVLLQQSVQGSKHSRRNWHISPTIIHVLNTI